MRVAMLVVNEFTHDTRVQKEAKTLTAAGYEVTVFALHRATVSQTETVNGYRVERLRLRTRGWGTHFLIRMLKYLEFCARAVARLVRMRPSVVHAHDVNALIPGYLGARLARAQLVYDAHELWAERRATLLQSGLLRRMVAISEGLLARRADAVVTVNPSIASLLADKHGIALPTVVMHCQEYERVERSSLLRQELAIPEEKRIVIYAGLLTHGRGLEMLIESAHCLDRAVVVLMGRDALNGRLQHMIRNHRLEQRVLIRDPVPPADVTRYVASADVGVIPTQNVDLSYYYGAGNKLFHYLMAGIPAAVSDHPEKRRIVELHDVGAVFDETKPRDIARVLNFILNDRQAYESMCGRARQVSRDIYNWEIEAQKLLAMYRRIQPPGQTSANGILGNEHGGACPDGAASENQE